MILELFDVREPAPHRRRKETMADEERAGPRNFAAALAEFGQGELNLKLGAEQQKLLAELQDDALSKGKTGISKGTIALTIKYQVGADGTLKIEPTFKVTAPKPGVPATVAWIDKHANISWQDPRQMKLQLREVPNPGGPAKDVPPRGNAN